MNVHRYPQNLAKDCDTKADETDRSVLEVGASEQNGNALYHPLLRPVETLLEETNKSLTHPIAIRAT
jgi:hypothetical protein